MRTKRASVLMRRAAYIFAESHGKMSKRRAFKQAGYSQESADNPQRFTKSKTWKDLMNELLPEDQMLDKLKENATQKRSIHGSNTALDMFFRLRGKYQKEQPNEEEVLDLDEIQKENERLKSKLYARRTTN